MKITSFYPVMYASKLEQMTEHLVQNFGCEIAHHFKKETPQSTIEYTVVKDTSGNRTDYFSCSSFVMTDGFFGMRANVDDFDAAAAALEEKGYIKVFGPEVSPSSIHAIFKGNNKSAQPHIVLFHHIKK